MGRKQKTIHYLYKTTCKVTGKYYIGMHSTNNLEDGYLGSGKRLRYSIRKYGKENHVKEILEIFDCREELIEAEKKTITGEILSDGNCMNLMSGGTGGIISSEHHKKMIEGSVKWMKTKWQDEKYRQKIAQLSRERLIETHKAGKIKYDTFTGKNHSEATKIKISKANNGLGIGESNSQFGTMWITNGEQNKKVKKESTLPDGWYKGRI